ncbi:MAG: glycosyltransferase family 4 protein, partial [Planctomycetota bacterium]
MSDATAPPSPATDRPLSIVHLTLASDAGGLSRYLIDLSRAMLGRGHDVRVVGDRGAWHDRFEAAGIPCHVVPLNGGIRGLWKSSRQLRSVLREHRPDVLHSHYRRASLMGRLSRIGAGVKPPLLYTLHLSHIDLGGWRRWLSDFGDHTHAASLDAVQWLKTEAGVDRNDLTYLPHGLATERFPQ